MKRDHSLFGGIFRGGAPSLLSALRVGFSTAMIGLALAIILSAGSAKADTIRLNFDTLPSDQGWTYSGLVPETSVFSVSGGVLTQDGRGLGDTMARYSLWNVIDFTRPFSIDFSLRVIDSDNFPVNYGAFQIGAIGPNLQANVYFYRIRDWDYSQIFATISTAPPWDWITSSATVDREFHDYSLNVFPDGTGNLLIDGKLVTEGRMWSSGSSLYNFLFFGDESRESEGLVQLRSYVFTQVPEGSSTLIYLVCSIVALTAANLRIRRMTR